MFFVPQYIRHILSCVYHAAKNTVDHDGIEHAGYLAFLGLLAFFPFLILLVALGGMFGQSVANTEYINILIANLPEALISALRPRIEEITSGPTQSLLTIAIFGAVWTASSGVEGLRTVLNKAYHVHTPPSYLWRRLLSIIQLILATFLIIMGMSLLVMIPIIWEYAQAILPLDFFDLNSHLRLVGIISSAAVLFIVVGLIYYILPNVKQHRRGVYPGALLVVVLWMVAAKGLSLYFSLSQQVSIIYGSLGNIIVTLLFFYILALIFIFGAEYNSALMRKRGAKIEQKEKVEEEPLETSQSNSP